MRPWEPEKVVAVVGNGRDASGGGSGEWGVGEEVDGWCKLESVIFDEEMGPMGAERG